MGRAGICQAVIPAADGESAAARRQARLDVRQASQDHAFTLLFQPRVALKTGALCGMQAQLRWPRRRGGRAPAGAFLPLLEESGVADDVAAWTMAEACRAALRWPDVPVCVAAPAWSVRSSRVLAHVGQALAETGLAPELLAIDVPAGALAGGGEDILLTLAALRDLGVGATLDEFGCDSACLLALHRMPLTGVKFDRALVRDLATQGDMAALMRATVSYAHALGMAAIASGLETDAQRTVLRRAGCDQAQGALCGEGVRPGDVVDRRLCA
jgi:EAL domain-containing protein (putative c-di-GMP-specific phosphodiesterase class I)